MVQPSKEAGQSDNLNKDRYIANTMQGIEQRTILGLCIFAPAIGKFNLNRHKQAHRPAT